MSIIAEALTHITPGDARTVRNLAMLPLLNGAAGLCGYRTLDEALAGGQARVTELTEGGSVPELRFVNDGDMPVFLLDGEELVGAKQNRALNVSILVAAKSAITIPVTCVEQGRWHYASTAFSSAPRAQYAGLRARKAADVSSSLSRTGSHSADQMAAWGEIAAKARRMEAASPTGAMAEVFERHAGSVDEYVEGLGAIDRQVGAVFAIGGHVVGMDLFDHPDTLRKLLPKLVRSYALDAIEQTGAAERADFRAFVERVAAAKLERFAAVGLGEDLRLSGAVAGGALAVNGRLVHLCAFALQLAGAMPATNVRGASERSQRYAA